MSQLVAAVRRGVDERVRTRVTAAAAAATLLAALLGSAVFVWTLRNNLERALASATSAQVDALRSQLDSGAQLVLSRRQDLVTQVLSPDGSLVATDHPELHTPLRTTPGTSSGVQAEHQRDNLTVVAARTQSGDLVVVGSSEEQVGESTRVSAWLLGAGVPLAVAVVALVVWVSVGRALRPVGAMRHEADSITSERLHQRLPVPAGQGEIPRLAETLNQMLDRIDTSQQLQRQFVTDASHELRSPLAAVRQMSEVARRHPDRFTVADLADNVLAEEQRMEQLVTALLTLARPDTAVPLSQPVDLNDVVLVEVAGVRPRSGVSVNASEVDHAGVGGDPVLLGQAVRNLLSNAVRHATARVRVRVIVNDTRAFLIVEDDGPGIPVSERENVFGRFVRLDEARARDVGGAGLGLAIVRKIVSGHNGTVAIDDSPLGGARFTVTLPLRGSGPSVLSPATPDRPTDG